MYFFRDALTISAINTSTSLMSGLVVFSVIGFMAKQQGVPVSEVAASGNKGASINHIMHPRGDKVSQIMKPKTLPPLL